MEFAKLMNCFKYLFTSSLFLTGQLSSFEMYAISFSLSLFSLLQSYSRWSTVWFPLAQVHSGDSITLKLYRYDRVFPWAVSIAVMLGVRLIFIFSRSLIFGKNSLVASPLVPNYFSWFMAVLFADHFYTSNCSWNYKPSGVCELGFSLSA